MSARVLFPWTDEQVALAKRMAAKGKSRRAIANALGGGVTRNAVIGKLRRLGVPLMDPYALSETRRVGGAASGLARATRPTAHAPKLVPVSPDAPVPAKPVQYQPPGACKWPIGDVGDEGFGFCGRGATHSWKEGGLLTYCAEHARRAYQPHKRKPSDKPDLRSQVPVDFRRWA